MKRYIRNTNNFTDDIFCMSNLRGSKINIPHKLPFSFYFSTQESSHAIRVKVMFNPNKLIPSKLGVLELHGNWKYTPGPDDSDISNKQINEMRDFFKSYKVLFAAVWEMVIPEDAIQDFFRGFMTFEELLTEFEFYEEFQNEMINIETIEELEQFVRNNNIFNMWD